MLPKTPDISPFIVGCRDDTLTLAEFTHYYRTLPKASFLIAASAQHLPFSILWLCRNNQVALLKDVLEKYPNDVWFRSYVSGRKLLQEAVTNGSIELLKIFLQYPQRKPSDFTHFYAEQVERASSEETLRQGECTFALQHAVECKRPEVIAYLLQEKAELLKLREIFQPLGEFAVQSDDPEIFRKLFSIAEKQATSQQQPNCQWMLHTCDSAEVFDHAAAYFLRSACALASLKVLRYLLQELEILSTDTVQIDVADLYRIASLNHHQQVADFLLRETGFANHLASRASSLQLIDQPTQKLLKLLNRFKIRGKAQCPYLQPKVCLAATQFPEALSSVESLKQLLQRDVAKSRARGRL